MECYFSDQIGTNQCSCEIQECVVYGITLMLLKSECLQGSSGSKKSNLF